MTSRLTIFCVHDADAYGTMIYQTFQEATKARAARKIEIINLGLEPWEAVEMGLEAETAEEGKRRKPLCVCGRRERILREAGFEEQVAATIAAIDKPAGDTLEQEIEQLFEREPDREWRSHIETVACDRTKRAP